MNLELAAQLLLRAELSAAADWWARVLLGTPTHQSGDVLIDMFTTLAGSRLDRVSERKVESFRECLTCLLAVRCAASWREQEPNWGSACRAFGTDYGPDRLLAAALDFAGIDGGSLRLPIKTLMWINPGSVKVRPGYSGAEVQIYPPS